MRSEADDVDDMDVAEAEAAKEAVDMEVVGVVATGDSSSRVTGPSLVKLTCVNKSVKIEHYVFIVY